MKHISIFATIFLASVSAHAACPEEPLYLAPVELLPQCESARSSEVSFVDDQAEGSALSETSSDSSKTVTQVVQTSTESN